MRYLRKLCSKRKHLNEGSVISAVKIYVMVFWIMTPRSLVSGYYCVLKEPIINTFPYLASSSSPMIVSAYTSKFRKLCSG
jgi:hypothetical protein